MSYDLQTMLIELRASHRRLPKPVDSKVHEALDRYLSVDWSATDMLEALIDEISTSVSVGSGLDRAVGQKTDEEDEDGIDKVLKAYNESIESGRVKSIKEFLARYMPGVSEDYASKIKRRLANRLRHVIRTRPADSR